MFTSIHLGNNVWGGEDLNIIFLLTVFKQAWTARRLKMEPIVSPETSVRNYHSTLRKMPEDNSFHSHRGESLKPRMLCVSFFR